MSYRVEGNVGYLSYGCSFNIWFVLLLIGFWIFSYIRNNLFEASLVKEIGNAGVLKILPTSTESCKIPLAVTEANLLDFSIAKQSEEPETSMENLKTSGRIVCIDESAKTEAKLISSNSQLIANKTAIKVLVLTTKLTGAAKQKLEGQEF
ncbi:hypothetical protein [Allocoleopsis sp.]|uniref:hypothetical protein n=1 Tax=Allocoleopsis sp. TaxID=3088169 RepID=UPI002FCE7BFD